MKSLDRMGARSIQWVQLRSIAVGPGRNASLSKLIEWKPQGFMPSLFQLTKPQGQNTGFCLVAFLVRRVFYLPRVGNDSLLETAFGTVDTVTFGFDRA